MKNLTPSYKFFNETLSECIVKTDTDKVPYKEPYFIRPFLDFSNITSIDYIRLDVGELGIKFDRTLNKLNFEINSDGNLVVVGEDANNYGINENGELIYDSTLGGIGTVIIEDTFIIS